jgi:hypothetical protein
MSDKKFPIIGRTYNEEGLVAVLYSPGFGAGWSTWWYGEGDLSSEFMTFDPGLVQLAERNATEAEVEKYLRNLFPDQEPYLGGWERITIHWVPLGTRFTIREYDGSEHIEYLDKIVGFTA